MSEWIKLTLPDSRFWKLRPADIVDMQQLPDRSGPDAQVPSCRITMRNGHIDDVLESEAEIDSKIAAATPAQGSERASYQREGVIQVGVWLQEKALEPGYLASAADLNTLAGLLLDGTWDD